MRRLLPWLLLCGCATTGAAGHGGLKDGWFTRDVALDGPTGRGSVQVRYTAGLPSGWEPGMTPPGDFAFYSPALGATLYADTSCGKRYSDAPLNVLLNHLMFGFEDISGVEQQERMLDGRAALQRRADATLDGVPVALGAAVLKNGPCVFDLVYVGSPTHEADGRAAFDAFVSGFQARFDP